MSVSGSYTMETTTTTDVMRLSDISDEPESAEGYIGHLPFCVQDEFTDVVLMVEGKELYTNRCLLAYASPVFSCMFTSEFREKNEKVITLPDKEFVAVCDMLCFLHPALNFTIRTDIAFRLLPLSDEYQIQNLKSACENHLIGVINKATFPNTGFLLKCLDFAEKCSVTNLLDSAIEGLTDPRAPLKCIKEYHDITIESKARVYEGKVEKLEKSKDSSEIWKHKASVVKNRLKDIIAPHDEHCRCRVEVKLRNQSVQRPCQYCSRQFCYDNISTDSYKNSYQFYCNHKIGYHIIHDAAIRSFLEQTDL